jgi:hypothetical protein
MIAFSTIFAMLMVVGTIVAAGMLFFLSYRAYKGANTERYDVLVKEMKVENYSTAAY